LSLILHIFAVKQERVKEQKVKRGKKAKASSAGEAFLNTLFAP
jgi:large subunit ribosomal protein L4e